MTTLHDLNLFSLFIIIRLEVCEFEKEKWMKTEKEREKNEKGKRTETRKLRKGRSIL